MPFTLLDPLFRRLRSVGAILARLAKRQPLPRAARLARAQDRAGLGRDPGIPTAVNASIDWLVAAGEHSRSNDGGIARHFSLIDGWGPSYPETTGYIIPTLLEHAQDRANSPPLQTAQCGLAWLVGAQLPEGAFQGGTVEDRPIVPVVFNTGQVLIGLSAGARRWPREYLPALVAAANWLLKVQEPDGSWIQHSSPFARSGPRAYDTHVAYGLLEAAAVTGQQQYADAARRNLDWASKLQRLDGWFHHCCLTDPLHPLTHTIGYALRGFIEGYRHLGDARYLEIAELTAKRLLETANALGFMPGRLTSAWAPAVRWSCLTGSAQIAHCWLQLYELTGHMPYFSKARAVNGYLRRTVASDGPTGTRGGVRGSFPISGDYGTYQFLAWAAKFFIDSNVLEARLVGEQH